MTWDEACGEWLEARDQPTPAQLDAWHLALMERFRLWRPVDMALHGGWVGVASDLLERLGR